MTDPHYICRFRDRSGRVVANDDSAHWIAPAFEQVARVMKPDTFCVNFYGWSHVEHFMTAWKAAGLVPVGHIVWEKGYESRCGFLGARHEQAYLLAKGRPPKPDAPLPDVLRWKYSGNPQHPTQKAVEILTPLIEAFSMPRAVVLDPFMGSGSTGVAAAWVKRRFIGIELERQHYDTATQRVCNAYPGNRHANRAA